MHKKIICSRLSKMIQSLTTEEMITVPLLGVSFKIIFKAVNFETQHSLYIYLKYCLIKQGGIVKYKSWLRDSTPRPPNLHFSL